MSRICSIIMHFTPWSAALFCNTDIRLAFGTTDRMQIRSACLECAKDDNNNSKRRVVQ